MEELAEKARLRDNKRWSTATAPVACASRKWCYGIDSEPAIRPFTWRMNGKKRAITTSYGPLR